MIELIIGTVLGGILSWLFTHIYYRKSSYKVPEWARPIIEKLPNDPPKKVELIKLFQEGLEKGEIEPHPIFGHVACPKCKSPSTDFIENSYSDDDHTVVSVECPHCGWSDDSEI